MYDSESVSLRRAALLLLVVSLARWGLAHRANDGSVESGDVLGAHVEATREATSQEALARRPLEADERIDPNRAGVTDLDRLPGVGPATARAIVAARDSVVFRMARDLMKVRGIASGKAPTC